LDAICIPYLPLKNIKQNIAIPPIYIQKITEHLIENNKKILFLQSNSSKILLIINNNNPFTENQTRILLKNINKKLLTPEHKEIYNRLTKIIFNYELLKKIKPKKDITIKNKI
jgi:hypothetical protein